MEAVQSFMRKHRSLVLHTEGSSSGLLLGKKNTIGKNWKLHYAAASKDALVFKKRSREYEDGPDKTTRVLSSAESSVHSISHDVPGRATSVFFFNELKK